MASEHFDCVVLGAGIAGLAAAQELTAGGMSVVVLESRSRVGGRLHTAEVAPGLLVDLGGAWIHGLGSPSSLNAIYALALRCGLQVQTTNYEDAVFYDTDYQPLGLSQVSRLGATYSSFAAFVAGIVARDRAAKTQLSVDDAVRLYAAARGGLSEGDMTELLFQVHNEIESYWAGDGCSMSIGTMDEVRLPGADAILCGGYGQLVEHLASGLDIRTSHAVTKVCWNQAAARTAGDAAADSFATCHTASGAAFRARRIIVTLPLGVLKSGSVAFEPPLCSAAPAKALAVRRLGTGMYNKVVLVFEAAFWDVSVMIHRIPPHEERGRWAWILNLQRVLGAPILVAFTTGSFASEMERLPDEEVGEQLLQVLRKMYPGKVTKPKKVQCTRWGSDPHSRMSYTYIPVGSNSQDCEALRQPIAQQLFFAGEATSRLFFGTVHGAYCTGLQAAEEAAAAEAARVREQLDVRAEPVSVPRSAYPAPAAAAPDARTGAEVAAATGRSREVWRGVGKLRELQGAGEGAIVSIVSGACAGSERGHSVDASRTGGTSPHITGRTIGTGHHNCSTGGTGDHRQQGGCPRASSSVHGIESELSRAGTSAWSVEARGRAAWSCMETLSDAKAVLPRGGAGEAGASRLDGDSSGPVKEVRSGEAGPGIFKVKHTPSPAQQQQQPEWGGGGRIPDSRSFQGGECMLLERSPAVGCSHVLPVISRL